MRLAERHPETAESHFTEGEPDLEPPEELAIGELDERAMLEEELDNEDLHEQDVDDDVLEASFEDLVHAATTRPTLSDEDDLESEDGSDVLDARDAASDEDDADKALGARDHEEGLDVVLLERLALLGDGTADTDGDGAEGMAPRPTVPYS